MGNKGLRRRSPEASTLRAFNQCGSQKLGKTLTVDSARDYVKRVYRFFAGDIEPTAISAGLASDRAPNEPAP